MRYVVKYALLFILAFLFAQPLWSQILTGSGNYWQCRAQDNALNQWVAKSEYKRTAINKAYYACKKQSKEPRKCRTANEYCDFYVNGIITTPMWQCSALDRMAKVWRSNYYRHRDDAALAAKAYCRDNSEVPTTCYVRLVACENLTDRLQQ